MGVEIDTRAWNVVGITTNSRFFCVERGVLAVMPLSGATDDGKTANENWTFESDYFRDLGYPGVVLVLMDNLVSQDKSARRVYQETVSPFVAGTGLIAESLLGRAIASFVLGIRRPRTPIKIFVAIDDALTWARAQLELVGCVEASK
jgi:hypothetical protein